jgi:excisionase family DNA binding protein
MEKVKAEGFLTVKSVAEYFGVPQHTIRAWIRYDVCQSIKVARRILIPVTEIDRLVEQGKR